MLLWENIKLAFTALGANKMRALLTMLGIIIGIGSVIAIMTVSSSLSASISDSFQEMGANNVTVGLQQKSAEEEVRQDGMKFGAGSRRSSVAEEDRITDDMLAEMKTQFDGQMDAVALSESVGSGTAERQQSSANIAVSGINPDYFESSPVTLLAGRYIRQSDLDGERKVILVSDLLADRLFDGGTEAALSQKISVNLNNAYTDYYIIGVYEYESSGTVSESSEEDVETSAYIPLTTAKSVARSDDGYTQFTVVTASDVESVSDFAEEIEAFFAPYYAGNETYEVSASTMESMVESMNDTVGMVSIAISFIAGISLLVGGIGVMNIMLVSITERTREIGTRKALGATNGFIRLQFIMESLILCLVGGCLGIAVGLALGAAASLALGYSAAAPVGAILVAVGFSMVIGVFFGFYPANKAARMDPIVALRYE